MRCLLSRYVCSSESACGWRWMSGSIELNCSFLTNDYIINHFMHFEHEAFSKADLSLYAKKSCTLLQCHVQPPNLCTQDSSEPKAPMEGLQRQIEHGYWDEKLKSKNAGRWYYEMNSLLTRHSWQLFPDLPGRTACNNRHRSRSRWCPVHL